MRIAQIHRHPERAVPEEAVAILEAGHVVHVGYVLDSLPMVIPFTYHYGPESPTTLYLHGAPVGGTLQHLVGEEQVCATVTLVDGLVFSRSAKSHSVNYRSVVCFGHTHAITDNAVKEAIFERMIARYFPDRTAGRDYAPPELGHLRGTAVIAIEIEEWSAKARRGGPKGPGDDQPDAPGTRGVIPFSSEPDTEPT